MSTAIAEMPRSVPAPRPGIVASARHLKKSYGNVTALKNLSMEIRRGELLALLGPNGAGKTTLVRLLLGSARPDAGTVNVFGADPHSGQMQSRVGALLQVGRVPETLKIREHIDLFSSYYPAPLPIEETMAIAGLTESRTALMANSPAGRSSACSSASPFAATLTCFSSTSPPSVSTWKRAASCGRRFAPSSRAARPCC